MVEKTVRGDVSRSDGPEHADGGIRRSLARVAFHCVVWSLVIAVLVPIVWPLMVSLNDVTVTQLVDRGVGWWLRGAEFDAVLFTLLYPPFLGVLANSVIVATATAVLSTALAAMGAYGIDRFDFFGRRLAMGSLLAALMIPPTIIAIPTFLLFHTLGLFDTRFGLVLAYLGLTLPFTTWLLVPYFSEIPDWLEEAAMVDGATRFGAFVRIFLPVAKPALAASFVLAWMLAYNEFLFASILIDTPAKRTLTVGLTYGVGDPSVVAVLASLPMLALFAVLWKFFLSGEFKRWVD